MDDLLALAREQQIIVAAIRSTTRSIRRTAARSGVVAGLPSKPFLLLQMTESLVAAHMAAKLDDDGTTLDLIEDAMRHVGGRLARETGDGRNFSRRRLGPL